MESDISGKDVRPDGPAGSTPVSSVRSREWIEHHKITFIDQDGTQHVWEDDIPMRELIIEGPLIPFPDCVIEHLDGGVTIEPILGDTPQSVPQTEGGCAETPS